MDETTVVLVEAVAVPSDSTLGLGFGRTLDGRELVAFVGDARSMSRIGDALAGEDAVVAMVPTWAIRLRIEVSEA